MNIKNVIIGLLALILLVIVWLFISEKAKNELKQKVIDSLEDENNKLQTEYFNLLEKYLLKDENPKTSEVIVELHKLKKNLESLPSRLHNEIDDAIKLINDGKAIKTIRELSVIIEDQLKLKIEKNGKSTKGMSLNKALNYAKENCWLNSNEYAYSCLVKTLRNKLSHNGNVQEESHVVSLALFSCVQIIYSIENIKESTLINEN
jgi:hypothetical protein